VRLADRLEEEIQAFVDSGLYVSASEFIREAVREKLESIKVVKLRDVSAVQARKEIMSFLKRHGEALPSDISTELNIDLDLVFLILKKLKEEGAGTWL
jgi:Arc/MetJ-type ribon-helix-helix transcriptional regulator